MINLNTDIGADTLAQPGHQIEAKVSGQATHYGKQNNPADGCIQPVDVTGAESFINSELDALAEQQPGGSRNSKCDNCTNYFKLIGLEQLCQPYQYVFG